MNILPLFLSLLPFPSVALFLFPNTPLIHPAFLNHFTGPVYFPRSPAWSSHSPLSTPPRLPSSGLSESAQMCHLCSVPPTDLSYPRALASLVSFLGSLVRWRLCLYRPYAAFSSHRLSFHHKHPPPWKCLPSFKYHLKSHFPTRPSFRSPQR